MLIGDAFVGNGTHITTGDLTLDFLLMVPIDTALQALAGEAAAFVVRQLSYFQKR